MLPWGKFDETRQVSRYKVRRYNIITTDLYIYRVWAPSINGKEFNHGGSTITTIDGEWHYALVTETLPKEVDDLPYGQERSAAVKKHYREHYELAYAIINIAFPETKGNLAAKQDDGDIEMRYADIEKETTPVKEPKTHVIEASEWEHTILKDRVCQGCGSIFIHGDLTHPKGAVERDAENELIAYHFICDTCGDKIDIIND